MIEQQDVLEELQRCKQQLIQAYGVSTKTVAGEQGAAQKTDAVMAAFNLDYKDEQPVIDFCEKNNKGLLIKSFCQRAYLFGGGRPNTGQYGFYFFRIPVLAVPLLALLTRSI